MPPATSEHLELLLEATKQAAGAYAALSADLENLTREVRYNQRMTIAGLFTLLVGVLAATGYYRAVSLPGVNTAITTAEESKP
jgi:hypothetical protein